MYWLTSCLRELMIHLSLKNLSIMKQQSKRHFSSPLPLPLLHSTALLNTVQALWDLALSGTIKIFCRLTYSYSSYPNNKIKDYIQLKCSNRIAPLINMGTWCPELIWRKCLNIPKDKKQLITVHRFFLSELGHRFIIRGTKSFIFK